MAFSAYDVTGAERVKFQETSLCCLHKVLANSDDSSQTMEGLAKAHKELEDRLQLAMNDEYIKSHRERIWRSRETLGLCRIL